MVGTNSWRYNDVRQEGKRLNIPASTALHQQPFDSGGEQYSSLFHNRTLFERFLSLKIWWNSFLACDTRICKIRSYYSKGKNQES